MTKNERLTRKKNRIKGDEFVFVMFPFEETRRKSYK